MGRKGGTNKEIVGQVLSFCPTGGALGVIDVMVIMSMGTEAA